MIRSGAIWKAAAEAGCTQCCATLVCLATSISRRLPRGSSEQRLALLQGLMDTDGSITRPGYAEFCSTHAALAQDVHELAAGLGLAPRLSIDRARLNGADMGPRYRVCFTPIDLPVFRLGRKLAASGAVRSAGQGTTRFIKAINPVAVCARALYSGRLAAHSVPGGPRVYSDPQHVFALNLAVNAAVKHNATVAIFRWRWRRSSWLRGC